MQSLFLNTCQYVPLVAALSVPRARVLLLNRPQGPHTRLFINGQLVYDFQSTSVFQTVTPCVTLASNQSHEIYLYFAAMVRDATQRSKADCHGRGLLGVVQGIVATCSVGLIMLPGRSPCACNPAFEPGCPVPAPFLQLNNTAPVGIQWANCSSPNQPAVLSTNYVSFSSA